MKDILVWVIDNGINQVACFLEILMILLCIHGIFKTKFRFTIVNSMLIVLDLVVIALINVGLLGHMFSSSIYIVLFMYCISKFKRKFWETLGRFLLSLFLVGLIEVLASVVAIPISRILHIDKSLMLLINAIGLLVTVVILKIAPIRKRKFHLTIYKETWGTLIALCGLSLLFIVVDYRLRGEADQVYYFIYLISCIVVFVSSTRAQAARHELENRKLQFEMKEIYGEAYQDLIAEVRRKQHDFKNQLSAIYSMHVTANSLEDLVEKQSEYGKVLLEECRYDKILIGCNNPILAGYLYYKCVAYEKSDVKVDYQIHVDGAECCLPLHEVIEILGILLTNAFESYHAEAKGKYIDLIVQESINHLTIEVNNQSKELTTKEIDKMFHEGYSSKGKNRGLGLARVKQLASKVNADIIVKNQLKQNKNWFSFRVMIPK